MGLRSLTQRLNLENASITMSHSKPDWKTKYHRLLELLEAMTRLVHLRDSYLIGPAEYRLDFNELRDRIDREVIYGVGSEDRIYESSKESDPTDCCMGGSSES